VVLGADAQGVRVAHDVVEHVAITVDHALGHPVEPDVKYTYACASVGVSM
jgi:hypothetical protein